MLSNPKIFCTHPQQNFIQSFAKFLLKGSFDLSSTAILLPTHRVCLQLKNELMHQADRLRLPTFFALNDMDGIFESFQFFEEPAHKKIPSLLKLEIFETLIERWNPTTSLSQRRAFSESLMETIDELLREEITLSQLSEAIKKSSSSSFSKYLNLVQLAFEHYPKIAAEYGFEDQIILQKRRAKNLANLLEEQEKFQHFWCAGFSQFQKDTLRLMQANLKNKSGYLAIPFVENEAAENQKSASYQTQKILHTLNQNYIFFKDELSEKSIQFQSVGTPFYQAKQAALLAHNLLKNDADNIAIICPQASHSYLLQAECELIGIAVNSSLGENIFQTPEGSLVKALITLLQKKDLPSFFIFIKHNLFLKGLSIEEKSALTQFELAVRSTPKGSYQLQHFDFPLQSIFQKLFQANFTELKEFCIEFIDANSQAGQIIFTAFDDILSLRNQLREKNKHELLELLIYSLEKAPSLTSPKPHGKHINLIGLMEARLCRYDAIIITDVNDGVIPRKLSFNPWLPKQVRDALNLTTNEEYEGLQLQDFLLSLTSANKVYLLHAEKIKGEDQLLSPYLSTIEKYFCPPEKKAVDHQIFKQMMARRTELLLTNEADQKLVRVPFEQKPKRLSLTAIKTLINDPMQFYGRYILNLKPLLSFEENTQALLVGQALHDGLDNFVKSGGHFFGDEDTTLFEFFKKACEKYHLPHTAMFENRLHGIAKQLCTQTAKLGYQSEVKGEKDLGLICIYAIADLITTENNKSILSDYKTGTVPSYKDIALGKAPQLPLEGVIFAKENITEVKFIKLAAKPPYVEFVTLKDIEKLITEAEAGIQKIAHLYLQDDFVFEANKDISPRDPYRHFARVQA